MNTWTIILTLVIVILSLYYYVKYISNYFERINLPYLKPVPFLGSLGPAILRQKTLAEIAVDAYNVTPKEAKYIGFFIMMKPMIMIRDPELIKTITVKSFDHFPNHRGFADEGLDILFKKNLFALKDDKWKEARTMLSPTFTLSKLKGMFKLMNECAIDFTNYLSKMPTSEKTLEMKNIFTRYTNDVIAACAFGITINSMKDPENDFYVNGKKATNFDGFKSIVFFFIHNFPWLANKLKLKLVPIDLENYFINVITDIINTRKQRNIVRNDMIQIMMEAKEKKAEIGEELTIIDIASQAFSFFFGGFDSISSAMCFTCHEIGVNPDIQKRLQDEIDDVIEKTNGNPTYDSINNMQYLDAVINESLRRYPIGVFLDRMVADDFELPPALPDGKPYLLKKDKYIWLTNYGLHHDPNYFENPYKFDPERFLIKGKEIINSGYYLPFGMGPRMCIANRFALLELKVLIYHLLARCNLKPCTKTQIPMKLSKKGLFSMASENGFWMTLEERNNVHPSLQNYVFDNDTSTDVKHNNTNNVSSNNVSNNHNAKM
ncbi:PREDICTED: cytochrome P450 9e2-like [Polistes dominula]|uniref:Cytochrome P450 9e2-like n=1 Tax=Polistes dominula TaxID=743375 RepID=A0ABM1IAR9_POLDO|nr:PREDICTED: cytochrome P450 9e2-like [Polistes dominula]